jgi:hypothetical protein
MKRIYIFLFIVSLISCTTQTLNNTVIKQEEPLSIEMDLNTEKELYHSNELMKINVTINSNKELNNASLIVKGINSRKRFRLNKEQKINLKKGVNSFIVEYTTPRCNTCSGIKEGTYEIIAKLIHDENIIANNSSNVEIKQ